MIDWSSFLAGSLTTLALLLAVAMFAFAQIADDWSDAE